MSIMSMMSESESDADWDEFYDAREEVTPARPDMHLLQQGALASNVTCQAVSESEKCQTEWYVIYLQYSHLLIKVHYPVNDRSLPRVKRKCSCCSFMYNILEKVYIYCL